MRHIQGLGRRPAACRSPGPRHCTYHMHLSALLLFERKVREPRLCHTGAFVAQPAGAMLPKRCSALFPHLVLTLLPAASSLGGPGTHLSTLYPALRPALLFGYVVARCGPKPPAHADKHGVVFVLGRGLAYGIVPGFRTFSRGEALLSGPTVHRPIGPPVSQRPTRSLAHRLAGSLADLFSGRPARWTRLLPISPLARRFACSVACWLIGSLASPFRLPQRF